MKNPRIKTWTLLSLLAAFGMACSLVTGSATPDQATELNNDSKPSKSEENTSQQTGGPTPTPPADVYPSAFAEYPEISVTIPEKYAGVGSYSLPVNLGQIKGIENIPLSADQSKLLSENGFLVVPGQAGMYKEFYQVYESSRYDSAVMFVTTDSIYHTYHLLFDKMLRDLETQHFIGQVKALTSAMIKSSQQQLDTLKGTSLEESAKRNLAFFVVASQLLQTGDAVPEDIKGLVAKELA
jgi:hypothetical protein